MTKDSPVGRPLTMEDVTAFTGNLQAGIDADAKEFDKASHMRYLAFESKLSKWRNYQFLEVDTEIAASWFAKLNEFVAFFHKTKQAYDLNVAPPTAKEKIDGKKRFDAGLENFKKFLEREPPKPPAQRLEILKRQKQEYLQAKRAEERKKSGNTRKLFDDNEK